MTRAPFLLFALAGCNSIFDLRPTQQIDAAYFDAPVDAPYACPMLGTAPTFAASLHQYVLQECEGYSVAANGRAAASCGGMAAGSYRAVYVGEPDQMLQPATGIPLPSAGEADSYDLPRISPDGEKLLVRHIDYDTAVVDMQYFARTSSGSWSMLAAPPFADRPFVSPLAQGPSGLHVLVAEFDSLTWTEWVEEGAVWRVASTHSQAELALPEIHSISITSDGLRAIIYGGDPVGMYYSDRPSLESAFSPAQPMPTLPVSFDAFMTADCARVYLSGLGYVFYVQQQ
ncbi:MAG: hypothetical protein HOV81_02105 [Kofleriaceae bacterium]|nr:hypothetical protein [Kofleriaceae bacterium]